MEASATLPPAKVLLRGSWASQGSRAEGPPDLVAAGSSLDSSSGPQRTVGRPRPSPHLIIPGCDRGLPRRRSKRTAKSLAAAGATASHMPSAGRMCSDQRGSSCRARRGFFGLGYRAKVAGLADGIRNDRPRCACPRLRCGALQGARQADCNPGARDAVAKLHMPVGRLRLACSETHASGGLALTRHALRFGLPPPGCCWAALALLLRGGRGPAHLCPRARSTHAKRTLRLIP